MGVPLVIIVIFALLMLLLFIPLHIFPFVQILFLECCHFFMGEERAEKEKGMVEGWGARNENKNNGSSRSYEDLELCAFLPSPILGICIMFYIFFPCSHISFPFSVLYLALEWDRNEINLEKWGQSRSGKSGLEPKLPKCCVVRQTGPLPRS